MLKADRLRAGATVLVMGLTFKENCADIRNSKVIDIVHELQEHGLKVVIWDPVADAHEAHEEYGVTMVADWQTVPRVDAVVVAVAHTRIKALTPAELVTAFGVGTPVIDIKSVFDRTAFAAAGLPLWRL
jgi:UDP-N-acetyl-D-galactosamine dehydrogenase